MRIIFLKAYDFPSGGASQNRLLGICRGLAEQNHKIEVHQFAPAKLNIRENLYKQQVIKNIFVKNHAWRFSPVSTKFKQYIGVVLGITSTVVYLLRTVRKERIDYVFINSEVNIYTFIFWITTKVVGAKLGRDLNEFPGFILKHDKTNRIIQSYKKRTNYKFFDVLFLISKELQTYYKPLAKKNVRVLYLPVTVELDRFNVSSNNLNSNFITYCGDLSQNKDGVMNLVKSFFLIVNEYPDIKLKLIGSNKDKKYLDSLSTLIMELNLSDKVVTTGFMHPDKIPGELSNSKLLVLSRPGSRQAEGGFPTKLGEYLSTGIPVAVTRVGEIPKFLEDNQSAFLAEPDNIEDFADAMRRALSDEGKAIEVGLKGKAVAAMYFSHSVQGKIISDFLKGK